ncbi:MAG TPA: mannosyl-3-phosphoglycerate synthase [Ktedonobacterales bacterium]
MEIETYSLPSIMDADRFADLDYFVRHTAFVVCHKSEPVDTLLALLRYIPADSPRIVVTNCPPDVLAQLSYELGAQPPARGATYLVHQKDERIAGFFQECGVAHILDASGTVANGKGEGMYIGAILAALLGIAEWIVYFDADNYAPSALLEYILAMSQSFTSGSGVHPLHLGYPSDYPEHAPLHNVRVCWASKPDYDGVAFIPQPQVLGRCTQVISPLCDELLRAWKPDITQRLLTSNAGEQGMTMAAATALRFSSGFSIETFQLLELALTGISHTSGTTRVRLQQYLSSSPHFHEKKDETHIRDMIAESLACFLVFQRHLPQRLLSRIEELARDLDIHLASPITYPPICRLPLARHGDFPALFRLDARMEDVSA